MVGNWSAAGKKAGKLCRSRGRTSSFTDKENWFRVVTSSSLVRMVPFSSKWIDDLVFDLPDSWLTSFHQVLQSLFLRCRTFSE